MSEQSSSRGSTERVLVFTATYNERDNIERFCDAVLAIDPNYDILVVDDGSPDGTGEFLQRLSENEPRVRVIHRTRKMGLGSAHKISMLHALKTEYPVLVTMDADFSHEPSDIPKLVAALDGVDFVIGSRHMKGGSIEYPRHRVLISVVANILARHLLGVRLHEFTTSYRAFRVPIFADLDFSNIRSQGYSFFFESVFRIHQRDFRYREVPIHFRDRTHGSSKIPRFEILRGAANLFRLFLSRLIPIKSKIPRQSLWYGHCESCGSPYLVVQPKSRFDPSAPTTVACLACVFKFCPEDAIPGVTESATRVHSSEKM